MADTLLLHDASAYGERRGAGDSRLCGYTTGTISRRSSSTVLSPRSGSSIEGHV